MVNYVQQLHLRSLLRDIDSWMDWLDQEDGYDLAKGKDNSLVSFFVYKSLFEAFYLLKVFIIIFSHVVLR